MDPYLEAAERWPDVHQRLITYIADALQPHIRPRYLARMGERVYVLPTPHVMYPDVLIMHPPLREATVAYLDWVVQVDEDPAPADAADRPVVLTLEPLEHREPFIEIVAAGGGDVVTVIEVLSPANKAPGEGHRQYRRKQRELLASAVNLVEIDFLSQGVWTIAWEEELIGILPPHRYCVNVRRAAHPDRREVYPIPLPRRLPRIALPLRAPDADVMVDLAAIFAQCYDNGGYAELVDYGAAPLASLTEDEVVWVDALLKDKGLR